MVFNYRRRVRILNKNLLQQISYFHPGKEGSVAVWLCQPRTFIRPIIIDQLLQSKSPVPPENIKGRPTHRSRSVLAGPRAMRYQPKQKPSQAKGAPRHPLRLLSTTDGRVGRDDRERNDHGFHEGLFHRSSPTLPFTACYCCRSPPAIAADHCLRVLPRTTLATFCEAATRMVVACYRRLPPLPLPFQVIALPRLL